MNIPSDEQQLVIDNLKNGYNVICSAVAGSGKSSTVLAASKQLFDKQILQITYNASLRLEIKEKVQVLGLPNITVHTFHSMAVKYYSTDCNTDTGIRYLLLHNTPPRTSIPQIDICMLDEFQDCTELYFKFVVKFLRDMGSPVQLLILGDPRQCLYEFKGADIRFLTMADAIWSDFELLSSKVFIHCSLVMSYRITNQMSRFVNDVMLGQELMSACRDGELVTYIRNNRKNIEKIVIYTINELLTKGGVKPNEIFVLAASVKGLNSHVRKMENALVEQNIPCHVPMFDTEKMDDRIIEGKIVFSTFHCAKGRQRKHVFVVGFDNNYFEQFSRTSTDKTQCPNTMYVGCTRATHGLYLLEFDQYPRDRPLEFLKMGHHEMKKQDFIKFNGTPRSIFYVDESEVARKSLIDKKYESPTKLIKFIPDYILDIITPIIEHIFVVGSPSHEITLPSIIQTRNGFFEAVSDLNGIAIPCMFYDSLSVATKSSGCGEAAYGTRSVQEAADKREALKQYENGTPNPSNVLYNMVENSLLEMKEHEHEYLKKIVKDLPVVCETIDDYLFLANVNNSIQERLYFKVKQIGRDEYTWLSNDVVNQCMERLNLVCGGEPGPKTSEFMLIHHSMEDAHAKIDQLLAPHFPESYRFRFSAILDLVTETSVWELKCTENINLDHKLQLIIYAWLWKMMDKPTKEFKLFNITSGELYTLNSGLDEELNTIVIALLRGKYDEQTVKTDAEFIEMCQDYLDTQSE
jgi:hypothetical protein